MTTAIRRPGTTQPAAETTGRHGQQSGPEPRSTVGTVALVGLRLALGFEFLWAFLDKLFGWAGRSVGYLGRRWMQLSVVQAQPWLR